MISESMRKQGAAIRSILDEVVTGIGATDEVSFNAAAAEINRLSAAVPVWRPDGNYKRGALTMDGGVPYWAMHDNGAASGQVHRPGESPTVWAHCHGTTPETAREFVAESHNPYNVGHYCKSGGKTWRSARDAVVFSPDVWPDGWEEVIL